MYYSNLFPNSFFSAFPTAHGSCVTFCSWYLNFDLVACSLCNDSGVVITCTRLLMLKNELPSGLLSVKFSMEQNKLIYKSFEQDVKFTK